MRARANPGKKLWEQIKELKNTKFSEALADWATEIRELGNIGAHPDKYEPKGITKETAEDIIEFTTELLDDLYIKPYKIKKRREKRDSLKKKST